mmetsp:Transcript_10003/g.22796  ORF Transcript_10003/g.22796 Transcript_10003/m.22796 type:complete len:100 (-) Transcript_10003:76-375(-)
MCMGVSAASDEASDKCRATPAAAALRLRIPLEIQQRDARGLFSLDGPPYVYGDMYRQDPAVLLCDVCRQSTTRPTGRPIDPFLAFLGGVRASDAAKAMG